MRVVPINEAECVLEPFWDGSTSDFLDKDPRYGVLQEYSVTTAPGTMAKIEQAWAWAYFVVEKAAEGKPTLTLVRDCDVDISAYDTFVACGSVPQNASLRILATLDGVQREVLPLTAGSGSTNEYFGKLSGNKLTALCVEIYVDGSASGNLAWFGAQDSVSLARMLAKKPTYSPEWPGFFVPAQKEYDPQIGLLFGKDELTALREKLMRQPFSTVMDKKREKAREDMKIIPETYIGRFVPLYDNRWCRSRDKKIGIITHIMENLAFVGLIDNDHDMMRMACRHLLSLCHCEYWCESMMGIFPGASWHHRSFAESFLARAAALVLDWAGGMMTPFGHQLVRDALAMKALPRIESDFRRIEYIRGMNQGLVFSSGRIFALLALLPRYPRYKSCLAEAEADVLEMVGNYMQPDGGTLEGPGYWMLTFGDIMPALYAVARTNKVPFTDYRRVFAKTGDFALGLMSLRDEGTVLIPINDAHPITRMSCSLACSFYAFTEDARWQHLFETLLRKNYIDEDAFALITVPAAKQATHQNALPTPPPAIFPATGQFGSVRRGRDMTTHVHYCSGLCYRGHYHQDKGSIILEADGTILCPDFGTGYYHDADLFGLTNPASHSLLLPVFADGHTAHQHANEPKGTVVAAEADENMLHFCTEEAPAWEGAPFERNIRSVYSPFAELIVLTDDYALDAASEATFVLNGNAAFEVNQDEAVMQLNGITLRVVPLNWRWEKAISHPMWDGDHNPVYQLHAHVGSQRQGKLITAVIMEKALRVTRTAQAQSCTFAQGELQYTVKW